ncbi:MAG: T9SS type A sorting domain-containing protein, partial [Candidatus Marinimicrobia bacterium]|nr:T9SS type A sorting domain-containing protein [Candidatus Neomarinimicrobiota bacterium]
AGDVNADDSINVLDVVQVVNIILGNSTRQDTDEVNSAGILLENQQVKLHADGIVAGIQLEVEGDFDITNMKINPGWEIYYTNSRIIMFSLTGNDLTNETLFEFEGNLTFTSGIVVDWNFRGTPVVLQGIPSQISLAPAYPNPFNPVTNITFGLPYDSDVKINVYDMLGREVDQLVNSTLQAGSHKIVWNARNISSGLYVVKMETGNVTKIQKVLLMK